MCEMLVMAGILYCTSFDNYLGSVNPGRLTIFDVIMFMSAVVVAASYDQNDSSLDLVQILISLVIGVFFYIDDCILQEKIIMTILFAVWQITSLRNQKR